MPGKVFVSCGQRGAERHVAERLRALLEKGFGLQVYLAFRIQSLQDVMSIIQELRSSDYYLLIDFAREVSNPTDLPMSLFTHQELAIAYSLGFENVIALQQNRAPLEGFLRYVLSNPARFADEDDLFRQVTALVHERGWNSRYSRNLVVSRLECTDPITYGDHTGAALMRVWELRVENRRSDAAALSTICRLDVVKDSRGTISTPDRSYLKWSGQMGYERTILPGDFAMVALFAVRDEDRGLFLLSNRDSLPRLPIITEDGEYQLLYTVFAQGFPLMRFSVLVPFVWQAATDDAWHQWEPKVIFPADAKLERPLQ